MPPAAVIAVPGYSLGHRRTVANRVSCAGDVTKVKGRELVMVGVRFGSVARAEVGRECATNVLKPNGQRGELTGIRSSRHRRTQPYFPHGSNLGAASTANWGARVTCATEHGVRRLDTTDLAGSERLRLPPVRNRKGKDGCTGTTSIRTPAGPWASAACSTTTHLRKEGGASKVLRIRVLQAASSSPPRT